MQKTFIFLCFFSQLVTARGLRVTRQTSNVFLPTVGIGSPTGAFGSQLSVPPPFNAPPYSDGTLGFPTHPQLKYRWGFGVDVLPRQDNVIFDGRIRTNSLPQDITGSFRNLHDPVGVKFNWNLSPVNTYRRAGLSNQELREEITRILLAQTGTIIPASQNPYNYLFQNARFGPESTGKVRQGLNKNDDIVGKPVPLTKPQKNALKRLAALARKKQRHNRNKN